MADEAYYQEMIKEYKKCLEVAVESTNELEKQNAALVKTLTSIQDICQSSNYRTPHTLLQMCDFLDNINNIIRRAIILAERKETIKDKE